MTVVDGGAGTGGPVSRDQPSVVSRTVLGWHLTFAALLVVLGGVIVVGDDPGDTAPQSLAAVGVLALAYLLLGLPAATRDDDRRGAAYLVVLVVAVGVLLGLEGGRASLLLFAAYPQIWFYAPSYRAGVVWAAVLCVVSGAGLLVGEGTDPDTIRDVVVSMGSGLAVSLVLGLWIGRIIEQSEQRADLIAELERTRAELGVAQHAAGVVAERERMAGEIHDTLAQGFTSIVALAQAESARLAAAGADTARLDLIEQTARQNLGEARALVAAFAPVDLQGSDVDAALARVADAVRRRDGRRGRGREHLASRGRGRHRPGGRAGAGGPGGAVERAAARRCGTGRAAPGRRPGPGGRGRRRRRRLRPRRGRRLRPGRHAPPGGGRGRTARRRLRTRSRHPAAGEPAVSERRAGPIRVLVVDDHPVVRTGLVALLQTDDGLEVVGEADDGAEVADEVRRLRAAGAAPDVVLMDLRMPRVDGATATEALLREAPGTAVLVLTTYDTDTDIVRAIEAGASGYLLKDVPRDRLLEGIRAAARGETVLAPSVAGHLVRRARQPDQPAPTRREIEVLDGVARGLTNAEIGRELFIGESTVKTHLLRLFAKLGVDDRTRAVTVALDRGLIRPPGRTG